jgi:hypothetical protein
MKPEDDDDNDLNTWVYEQTLPISILKLLGSSFRPPNNANVGVNTVVGGKDDDDTEYGMQVGGNYCSAEPRVGWLPAHNLKGDLP